MNICSITGTIYTADGTPKAGERITIIKSLSGNAVLSNRDITYYSDRSGVITIPAIQGSYIYPRSDYITGLDGTTPVYVPMTSEATLGALLTGSTTAYSPRVSYIAVGGGSNAGLTGTAGQIAVFSGTSSATGVDQNDILAIYKSIGAGSASNEPLVKFAGDVVFTNGSSTALGINGADFLDGSSTGLNAYWVFIANTSYGLKQYSVNNIIDSTHFILGDFDTWDETVWSYGTTTGTIYKYQSIANSSSFAFGTETLAKASYSWALGNYAQTLSYGCIAIGQQTIAEENHAVAIGGSTEARGAYSVAVGSSCCASTFMSYAYGRESYADHWHSVVINTGGADDKHSITSDAIHMYAGNGLYLLDGTRAYIDDSVTAPLNSNELVAKAYVDNKISGDIPASATANGTAGTIAYDNNYIYICTATNTWKRTSISGW